MIWIGSSSCCSSVSTVRYSEFVLGGLPIVTASTSSAFAESGICTQRRRRRRRLRRISGTLIPSMKSLSHALPTSTALSSSSSLREPNTSNKARQWWSGVRFLSAPWRGESAISLQRKQLKEALLIECQASVEPTAVFKRPPSRLMNRTRIDAAIAALAAVSPVVDAPFSPQLQQTWRLVWTTEQEINFFLQQGWTALPSDIIQTISGTTLTNCIPLSQIRSETNDTDERTTTTGSFAVVGRLSRRRDEDPIARTRFAFESARLDLGRWGRYTLPPLGKGWFDTLYLDETFRVDVNSRNDVLICQRSSSESSLR